MNVITNSKVKERFRQQNVEIARQKQNEAYAECGRKTRVAYTLCSDRKKRAREDYNAIERMTGPGFWSIGFDEGFDILGNLGFEALGILCTALMGLFCAFILMGITQSSKMNWDLVWGLPVLMEVLRFIIRIRNAEKRRTAKETYDRIVREAETEYKSKESEYQQEFEAKKRKVNEEADAKTRKQIAAYEKAVNDNISILKQSGNSLDHMVQLCEKQLDEYIGTTVTILGDTEQYIQLKCWISIGRQDIRMSASTWGTYTRVPLPQATIGYLRERYRFLETDAECEAVAAVVTTRCKAILKNKYQMKQAQLRHSHNDADVTMEFRMMNTNYKSNTVLF